MKCPKCGSEMQHINANMYQCNNQKCLEIMTKDFILKQHKLNQQRLDKVLKKFETNMKWNSKYYFLTEKGFSIMCNQFNEFYLYWFNSNNRYKISLDTVEHLIRDMEAQNETN